MLSEMTCALAHVISLLYEEFSNMLKLIDSKMLTLLLKAKLIFL